MLFLEAIFESIHSTLYTPPIFFIIRNAFLYNFLVAIIDVYIATIATECAIADTSTY